VVAVDVGRGQLHERLRADARVEVLERTHIGDLAPDRFGEQRFGLVVADLSFISLTRVARALVDLTGDGGHLVLLVKPQFEAGRREAARGRGVIRDPAVWRRVLEEVITAFHGAGAAMMGVMPSPLRGADGNVEFLVSLIRRAGSIPGLVPDDQAAIDTAVAAAIGEGVR